MNEEDVIGFDALYESARRCRRGVMWKDSVAAYSMRGIERTSRLCDDLHTGAYRSYPVRHFTVTSPKRREIASIAFRDRVYQRSLNDNAVYPIMSRRFIYDNYACQKGKGTDAARERMKQFLRQHYRTHGTAGYVAAFDIKGYYPNMNHEVVERMFASKLPGWAAARVIDILREQYKGDKGYNPGSQLVQIAGISLLDEYDHFAKERLRVRHYIRYMDDIIMIHPERDFLARCATLTAEYLQRVACELNPLKTRIFPLTDGIEFLGFVFTLTATGKVLMQIRPGRVKAVRKKLARLAGKSKAGGIPRASVDASYAAWRAHAAKGNSYRLLQRMDNFYNALWE